MLNLPRDLKISFVGGDERQLYAGIYLADKGYDVSLFGFDEFKGDISPCKALMSIEELKTSDVVVLPMPVSQDGKNVFLPMSEHTVDICDLQLFIREDTLLLGGRTGDTQKNLGRKIVDYFEMEELQIANAYLTAESAVAIAMKESKESIRDNGVMVVGYGRIGKCLCHILKGMGVNVYASARKRKDFEWIRAFGYSPVDTSKVCNVVSECKIIFNTVPGLVIGRDILYCMPKDCLIIDLASKPGGVDFEAAMEYGLKTVWALGLPGKELPESAGRAVAKTIIGILEDEGVI